MKQDITLATLSLIAAILFLHPIPAASQTSTWGVPTEKEIIEGVKTETQAKTQEAISKPVDIRVLEQLNSSVQVPEPLSKNSEIKAPQEASPQTAPAVVKPEISQDSGITTVAAVPEPSPALPPSDESSPPWMVDPDGGIFKWMDNNWIRMPGFGKDISAGPEGSVWHIANRPEYGGFGIHKWNGSKWAQQPGGAVRIDVGKEGIPWVVNSGDAIYRWNGNNWDQMPGAAKDIGVGADGSVWIIGTNSAYGGFGIYQWNGSGWDSRPGGAVRVDVGNDGTPWVVNDGGAIYRWNGRNWDRMPGAAKDIVIENNHILAMGTEKDENSKGVKKWTGSGWGEMNGDVKRAAPQPRQQVTAKNITWSFETGSLAGWTKTGTAFDFQPTYGDNPTARHRNQPSRHEGTYWIGTFEKRPESDAKPGQIQGDGPKGTLLSQPFLIEQSGISFLIGGGCDINKVRVELIVNNAVVKKATGKCRETMTRINWDVSTFKGQNAQFRIIDDSSGGWGHINLDDIRFTGASTLQEQAKTAVDYGGQDQLSNKPAVNWDFETGTLEGWTKTGTAFNFQPTFGDNPTARHRGQPSGHEGNFWIGSFEKRPDAPSLAGQTQGDGPKGTLISKPFMIDHSGISFLIGGGCDISKVRAELLINNAVVKKATGKCRETMTRVNWDVSAFKGQNARFRIVDDSSGGWGHINLDDIRISGDSVQTQ